MEINSVISFNSVKNKQNFKGNSASSDTISGFSSFPKYQPIPLSTSKAYASPQITEGYKEVQTVEVPLIGKGKVYELANGHKVILIPKSGSTIIHTKLSVGENDEPANLKQTGHLLEHLLYGYVLKPNPEVKEILDRTCVDTNAYNSPKFSGYHMQAFLDNKKDFEDLIKIQAEALQNTSFSEQDVENEKKIISQELESLDKFTPDILIADKLTLQSLFNLDDSDSNLAQRSTESINNIKKADLVNYYNTFYQPKNMVTTIVGDVDDNSIKTIAKYLGKTPSIPKPIENNYPKLDVSNPLQKSVRKDTTTLNPESKKALLYLNFIGPKSNDFKEVLLADTLCWAINEKLGKADLDDKARIMTETISSDPNLPSIFTLISKSKDEKVEKNLKDIYSVLYEMSQNPISEKELSTIKDNIKNDWSFFAEDIFTLSDGIGAAKLLDQSVDRGQEFKFINSITAKDLQETAKKYIDLNKASIVVVHPQKKSEETKGSKDITFKGKLDETDAKDIHEYILPNNLRVVIDSRPGIARSSVKFKLNSQKTLYANPEAGFSLFSLLTSRATREKLEAMGVDFNVDTNNQQIVSTFNGSPDKTLEMLGYAAGIILKPGKNKDDFNEIKNNLLKDEDFMNPKANAYTRMNDELNADNPYHETRGNFKDLEFEDLKLLYKQILNNAQGTVFITIPPEQLQKDKEEIFQTLLKVPKLKPYNYNAIFEKYSPKPIEKTKVFTEESKNNHIDVRQIFRIKESGNIKDRAGLMLLNCILGGGGQSKLFKTLRNEDKLAYDASSTYSINNMTGSASVFYLSTSVPADNKQNLKTVVSEFDKCLKDLIDKPITQEELDRQKRAIKSELLMLQENSLTRNDFVSGYYNSFYGKDYLQELVKALNEMTPEYLQELAKYYLTKPYFLEVLANKDTLAENKEYLQKLGEVVES